MSRKIRIDTKGIKSALDKLNFSSKNFYKSIAEYIWNGFDAKATKVEVMLEVYDVNKIGLIRKLIIKDNGTGINYDKLKDKFDPVFDSDRLENGSTDSHISTYHGKNGVGRLTFFTFANFAKWTTIFERDSKKLKYDIKVSSDELHIYAGAEEQPKETDEATGTMVFFSGFLKFKTNSNMENEILDYLRKEFSWFLELNKEKEYRLLINGKDIDYLAFRVDEEFLEIFDEKNQARFNIKYLRWTSQLNDEYSKFYYMDENKNEVYKENTKLNNQGDDFFHSVYISSPYFKEFNFKSNEDSQQKAIHGGVRSDKVYKNLMEKLYRFLRMKRKPFLRKHSHKIIADFKSEGILPIHANTKLEEIQQEELTSVVKEIYEIQPKIFSSLRKEQKQVMVGLFKLLLDSGERERIIEIIEQIIKLEPSEREELSNLLKVTKLNRIIKTIDLIKERYKVVAILKQLVFKKELKANEIKHLQGLVGKHYWIFGEQYNLVSEADDDFDKALRNYQYILTEKDEYVFIDSKDKKKRMDIFLCRQRKLTSLINNTIIELKHPKVKLGGGQLSQVKKYMNIILSEPRFNSKVTKWEFYLVGNEFDSSGEIERDIENAKHHGENSLVYEVGEYKIYVKTWSELLDEFEIRHNFLNEKLELDKNKLIGELKSADEGLNIAKNSIAKASKA